MKKRRVIESPDDVLDLVDVLGDGIDNWEDVEIININGESIDEEFNDYEIFE